MSHDPTLRSALEVLAGRLSGGVLLLDADGSFLLANAAAARLLGATGEPELRQRWSEWSAGIPASGGEAAGWPLPDGRRLRVARQPLTGGAAVIFLDEPGAPAPDRIALVEAARARRQEQLVAGYLHDFNGPLNNFNLTLALLEATVTRALASAPGDVALTRCERHIGLLQNESRRLLAWSRGVAAGLIPPEVPGAHIELGPLLEELARTLRHHAALHEVTIAVQAADAVVTLAADPWQLRLALLHLTSALIALAEPGSRVDIGVRTDASCAHLELASTATTAPPALLDDDRDIARESDTRLADLVAGGIAVEAIGGTASMTRDAHAALRVRLALPLVSV